MKGSRCHCLIAFCSWFSLSRTFCRYLPSSFLNCLCIRRVSVFERLSLPWHATRTKTNGSLLVHYSCKKKSALIHWQKETREIYTCIFISICSWSHEAKEEIDEKDFTRRSSRRCQTNSWLQEVLGLEKFLVSNCLPSRRSKNIQTGRRRQANNKKCCWETKTWFWFLGNISCQERIVLRFPFHSEHLMNTSNSILVFSVWKHLFSSSSHDGNPCFSLEIYDPSLLDSHSQSLQTWLFIPSILSNLFTFKRLSSKGISSSLVSVVTSLPVK